MPVRIVFSSGKSILVAEDTSQVGNTVKNRSREFVKLSRVDPGATHDTWVNPDQILYFEDSEGDRQGQD